MLSMVFILPACEKEPVPDEMEEQMMEENECNLEGVTYNAVVKDILSGCQGSSCHGAGTGREMTDFASAKSYAQNGRIIGALNRDSGFSAMPQGGAKLAQCKIDQVKAWIDADYPEG